MARAGKDKQMNRTERLEALASAVIPEAVEWVSELRKYRTYQGKDPEYFRKARVGLGVIGSGVRLCATIENSRTNDLVEKRFALGAEEQLSNRQLPSGRSDA
jgi:hypothetical protein